MPDCGAPPSTTSTTAPTTSTTTTTATLESTTTTTVPAIVAVDDDFTMLNPTASAMTAALILPLENDDLVDPASTQIVSVTQPTAYWGTNDQNYGQYQIGEIRIASDGQRLIWDLDPPDGTVTANGLPLLDYPPDLGFPGRILGNPMPVGYTISDGVREATGTLVLHINTPDTIPFPFNPDASSNLVPTPSAVVSTGALGFGLPYEVPLLATERGNVMLDQGTATFTVTGPAPVCIPSATQICTDATSFSANLQIHLPTNAPALSSDLSVGTTQFVLTNPLEVSGLAQSNFQVGFRSVQVGSRITVSATNPLPITTHVGSTGVLSNVTCRNESKAVVPCPTRLATINVPLGGTDDCSPWDGANGLASLLRIAGLGYQLTCAPGPLCATFITPAPGTEIPVGMIVQVSLTRPTCP